MSLFGMRVIEDRHGITRVPVLQMDPEFKWCSEAFRAETNRWLLDLFGHKEVAYIIDSSALGFGGGQSVVMSPASMAYLRNLERLLK